MLHGDIYDMQRRVKDEYPNHDIVYVGDGHYNVIEKRRQLRYEGDHNGCPLFSMQDVADVVFSFDHIPDMRVLNQLRDSDLWRHPGGPMAAYDEMMERTRKEKERREKHRHDEYEAAARDRYKRIVAEVDNMSKSYY